ncbi:hypothetical protein [uncultured Tateyamaria sp.]|uniref:TetR/AcrR family transcriptional regulator n=1 Tax=uncultured Tateyamaria sp. TaxID=455651 RepID=UPI0026067CD9|nr:hypothetical protein [uncultured Tateyamaria sp.]
MREIAEVAQAYLFLISRYFGGKEGLLAALTDAFVASRREGGLSYPPQNTLEDEIRCYLHAKLHDDLKDEEIVRLIISRAAIDAAFREGSATHIDGKADQNFRARVRRLQDDGRVSADVDVDLLFTAVVHVSFSVNFFGAMIGARPRSEIEALFHGFAKALSEGVPVQQEKSGLP